MNPQGSMLQEGVSRTLTTKYSAQKEKPAVPSKQEAAWHLLYTEPRAEKKVNSELHFRGYETFLPLHRTLKQWSDRKKWVEEPLFKSYIFIHTQLERSFYDVLNIPGIVKWVSFEKKPVVVDPREMLILQRILGVQPEGLEISDVVFAIGSDVQVVSGPLAGLAGKVVDTLGGQKFSIEIQSLQQSLRFSISASLLVCTEQL